MTRPGAGHGDPMRDLAEELREAEAPDLTGPIMSRLGYVPVTREAGRRLRARAWAGRMGACAVALLVGLIAFHLHGRSPAVRQPAGPTLPGAIGHDVSLQQERFRSTMRTIMRFAPTLAAPASPAGTPTDPLVDDAGETAPAASEALDETAPEDDLPTDTAVLGTVC